MGVTPSSYPPFLYPHEYIWCNAIFDAHDSIFIPKMMRWLHVFLQKINMLESSGPSTSTMTTAQHQQMARQISSQADFAEEYFASLSAPAKRLIEVRIR